jgi:hypothetical protein
MELNEYIDYLNSLFIQEVLDFDYYVEGKRSTVDSLTILGKGKI